MQIQLKSPKIWLANEPVDFRKAIDGLSILVQTKFSHPAADHLYIFYNRARNKIKLLARHRNGTLLVYKRLDKNRFTFKKQATDYYTIDERQLSWLLAGLDWISMSDHQTLTYDDYY